MSCFTRQKLLNGQNNVPKAFEEIKKEITTDGVLTTFSPDLPSVMHLRMHHIMESQLYYLTKRQTE